MTPRPLIINNICVFISELGKSDLKSVLLWPNTLHSLQSLFTIRHIYHSAVKYIIELCFLWGLSGSHYLATFHLGFWTAKTPKSKCETANTASQHEGATEWNQRWSAQRLGAVSHCFNLSWRSSYLYLINSRTRSSSTFTVTSAREESVKANRKLQLLLLPGLLFLSELHWFFCQRYRQLWILLGGGAHRVWPMHAHVCVFACVCMCLLADGCHYIQ